VTKSKPRGWEFDYATVPTSAGDDDGGACDVVVATESRVEPQTIAKALASMSAPVEAMTLLDHAPIHWTRVRAYASTLRADIHAMLEAAGIAVRYVASASRGSIALAPPLRANGRPSDVTRGAHAEWKARRIPDVADSTDAGFWYLHETEGGVAIDRTHCGSGSNTRLAVIDYDTAEIEQIALDALVHISPDAEVRGYAHGALMLGWAAACRAENGYRGVAPSTSPRLYRISKPGKEVFTLPVAIASAARDGADVIVCATYVEGMMGPLLDDALTFATTFGRKGRGTAVVFPTGREASSPAGSLHASWALAFSDPASDPRVFCVGPSAKSGRWFTWRDKKGRLRPFANRGPAVRWLAPGDDISYPLTRRERLCHAESSGASAIAAGVLALVIGENPRLTVSELGEVVTRTLAHVSPEHDPSETPLADAHDVLPTSADRDGHNAKNGYGRIHALRACLVATDPLSSSFVAIGEDDAARIWSTLRRFDPQIRSIYSRAFGRWMARALLRDASLFHAARAIARHLRLLSRPPLRASRHPPQPDGSITHQLVLALRRARDAGPRPSKRVGKELDDLERRVATSASHQATDAPFLEIVTRLFPAPSSPRSVSSTSASLPVEALSGLD
jgi:hypothetical protein